MGDNLLCALLNNEVYRLFLIVVISFVAGHILGCMTSCILRRRGKRWVVLNDDEMVIKRTWVIVDGEKEVQWEPSLK
jgi:hypothetical protein